MSNSQDQNFFSMFMLVLGALVAVSFIIFLLARDIASRTQQEWVTEGAAYAQQVDKRIKPVGRVAVAGQEAAPLPQPEAKPVAEVLSGPQVYNSVCLACHGAGIGGAPKFGDKETWAPRIAQGKATLSEHVLKGYSGNSGYMPPKGGRVDLSDDEILSAMQYMIDQAR